jgi:hypothetical protein
MLAVSEGALRTRAGPALEPAIGGTLTGDAHLLRARCDDLDGAARILAFDPRVVEATHSKVHEPGVRSWLLQALRSTDWTIRAAAARALANYPEPDVAAALTFRSGKFAVPGWTPN